MAEPYRIAQGQEVWGQLVAACRKKIDVGRARATTAFRREFSRTVLPNQGEKNGNESDQMKRVGAFGRER